MTLRIFLLLVLLFTGQVCFSQNITTLEGTIKDSITSEPISFATIQFENTSIGVFSDAAGRFQLKTFSDDRKVIISFLGYKTKTLVIPDGKSKIDVYLAPDNLNLNEIIVMSKKRKYSKKDNPAVTLIKKVIAHKHDNYITDAEAYQCDEYKRLIFALDDFNPDKGVFKNFKFLSNYMDTSLINASPILPLSIRESTGKYFYRKKPRTEKRLIEGYKISGLDQELETEGMDAIINEVFQEVSIYDNSITFIFRDFISPLSENNAPDFYKWYIMDTVKIDNKKYIDLAFIPFNPRDIGFTGNLYIALDSTYAVKRAILKAPRKININFVDDLIIQHEFRKTESGKWVVEEKRTAMNMSLYNTIKTYVDQSMIYENYTFNPPTDSIYDAKSPNIFAKDYDKRSSTFWAENKPASLKKDFRMEGMVEDIKTVPVFNLMMKTGKVLSSGYFHTSKDEEKNKLDIGTILTMYSFNSLEGNRFRVTGTTTRNFHPHLYLYGYAAYGTKDGRFKYYGEATWAFNDVKDHKDQFPKNNLTVAYKYDINSLGQRFTQAERDNILMSVRSSNNSKLTYNRQTEISYEREHYNGLSYGLSSQTYDEEAAGNLIFKTYDDATGNSKIYEKLRTTEFNARIRFAPKEKFYQQRRKRSAMPSNRFVTNLSYTLAPKGIFGSQYNYKKIAFSSNKEFWMGPYGRLNVLVEAEKLWGEVPFPLLITPSANNSYTIQKGSFYLIDPLEFIHDAQVSWDVNYRMGGWLFNRIPLLNRLKWREVIGFRGFIGKLSDRNNPIINKDMIVFPEDSYTAHNTPYMEYNIGIENIFQFFRIDYVKRLNYLDHENINKDGFRISFDFNF